MNLYWASWIDDGETDYSPEFAKKHNIPENQGIVFNEDAIPKNENILSLWCSGINFNADWEFSVEGDPVLYNCTKEEYVARYGYCMVAHVLAKDKFDAWEEIKKEYPHVNTIGHIRFINRLPYRPLEETLKDFSRESDSRFPLNNWQKERVIKAYEKITEDLSKNLIKINWSTVSNFIPAMSNFKPNDCDLYLVVKIDALVALGRPLLAGIHSDTTLLVEMAGEVIYLKAEKKKNRSATICILSGGKPCVEPCDENPSPHEWIELRILPFEEAKPKLGEKGAEVVREILNIPN